MFDRKMVKTLITATVICGLAGSLVLAEEKPAPKGSVVLTVGGKAANWNRGAMAPARDTLMKHHNISFERAMAFDLDTLSGLPQQELKVLTPAGNGSFQGPLLVDVLKASGANVGKIRLVSLDGSATELTPEDVTAHNWILTLAVDSKPVGIGDFGPLWLMHKPASGSTPSAEEMERWVWSVFYIEVL
jgi:hypothetical protein